MKIVLSPAKSLDFESKLPTSKHTEAAFLKESERLNKLLKKKSARSLKKLMNISRKNEKFHFRKNEKKTLAKPPSAN